MRTLTLFSLLSVFLFAAPAIAKVSSMPIAELVAGSEEIVIATVTDVSAKPAPDMKPSYASAVVQRTLKGSLAGAFRLWAYPTWTCDISEAVKGETVLLFLKRGGDGYFTIQFAGRGRMPLRVVDGRTYVTLWDDIVLPKAAPTIAGPDPKYGFIVSVELAYIESLVTQPKKAQRAAAGDARNART
jgi:hypothetical protein